MQILIGYLPNSRAVSNNVTTFSAGTSACKWLEGARRYPPPVASWEMRSLVSATTSLQRSLFFISNGNIYDRNSILLLNCLQEWVRFNAIASIFVKQS